MPLKYLNPSVRGLKWIQSADRYVRDGDGEDETNIKPHDI